MKTFSQIEILNSHIWLVVTILKGTDGDHSYRHRNSTGWCWSKEYQLFSAAFALPTSRSKVFHGPCHSKLSNIIHSSINLFILFLRGSYILFLFCNLEVQKWVFLIFQLPSWRIHLPEEAEISISRKSVYFWVVICSLDILVGSD